MKRLEFATKADAKQMSRIIDKAMGLPLPGTFLGGGPTSDTLQGTDQWTTIKRKITKVKDAKGNVASKSLTNTWLLIADGAIQDVAKNDDCRARLTKAQCDILDAAIAAARTVTDDVDDFEDDDV